MQLIFSTRPLPMNSLLITAKSLIQPSCCEEEVRRILGQTEKVSRQQISEVPFEIGDAVKIKEGPFKDFDGVVDEIHPEKGKINIDNI